MLGDLLLKKLNELRLKNVLCDLQLVSSDHKLFNIHQVVFTALNRKHFMLAVDLQYGYSDEIKILSQKKMYFSQVSSVELELLVDFLYGGDIKKKNIYDVLASTLGKLDMKYLLDDIGAISFDDEPEVKTETDLSEITSVDEETNSNNINLVTESLILSATASQPDSGYTQMDENLDSEISEKIRVKVEPDVLDLESEPANVNNVQHSSCSESELQISNELNKYCATTNSATNVTAVLLDITEENVSNGSILSNELTENCATCVGGNSHTESTLFFDLLKKENDSHERDAQTRVYVNDIENGYEKEGKCTIEPDNIENNIARPGAEEGSFLISNVHSINNSCEESILIECPSEYHSVYAVPLSQNGDSSQTFTNTATIERNPLPPETFYLSKTSSTNVVRQTLSPKCDKASSTANTAFIPNDAIAITLASVETNLSQGGSVYKSPSGDKNEENHFNLSYDELDISSIRTAHGTVTQEQMVLDKSNETERAGYDEGIPPRDKDFIQPRILRRKKLFKKKSENRRKSDEFPVIANLLSSMKNYEKHCFTNQVVKKTDGTTDNLDCEARESASNPQKEVINMEECFVSSSVKLNKIELNFKACNKSPIQTSRKKRACSPSESNTLHSKPGNSLTVTAKSTAKTKCSSAVNNRSNSIKKNAKVRHTSQMNVDTVNDLSKSNLEIGKVPNVSQVTSNHLKDSKSDVNNSMNYLPAFNPACNRFVPLATNTIPQLQQGVRQPRPLLPKLPSSVVVFPLRLGTQSGKPVIHVAGPGMPANHSTLPNIAVSCPDLSKKSSSSPSYISKRKRKSVDKLSHMESVPVSVNNDKPKGKKRKKTYGKTGSSVKSSNNSDGCISKLKVSNNNSLNQSTDSNEILNQREELSGTLNQSNDYNDSFNQSDDCNEILNKSSDSNVGLNQSCVLHKCFSLSCDSSDILNQSSTSNYIKDVNQSDDLNVSSYSQSSNCFKNVNQSDDLNVSSSNQLSNHINNLNQSGCCSSTSSQLDISFSLKSESVASLEENRSIQVMDDGLEISVNTTHLITSETVKSQSHSEHLTDDRKENIDTESCIETETPPIEEKFDTHRTIVKESPSTVGVSVSNHHSSFTARHCVGTIPTVIDNIKPNCLAEDAPEANYEPMEADYIESDRLKTCDNDLSLHVNEVPNLNKFINVIENAPFYDESQKTVFPLDALKVKHVNRYPLKKISKKDRCMQAMRTVKGQIMHTKACDKQIVRSYPITKKDSNVPVFTAVSTTCVSVVSSTLSTPIMSLSSIFDDSYNIPVSVKPSNSKFTSYTILSPHSLRKSVSSVSTARCVSQNSVQGTTIIPMVSVQSKDNVETKVKAIKKSSAKQCTKKTHKKAKKTGKIKQTKSIDTSSVIGEGNLADPEINITNPGESLEKNILLESPNVNQIPKGRKSSILNNLLVRPKVSQIPKSRKSSNLNNPPYRQILPRSSCMTLIVNSPTSHTPS